MFRQLLILFTLITVAASYGQGFNKRYKLTSPALYGVGIVNAHEKYYTIGYGGDSAQNEIAIFTVFNDTGGVLSSKTFRVDSSVVCAPGRNLIKTHDNCFVNGGYLLRSAAIGSEALIIKYDSTGNVKWYNSYPSGNSNNLFFTFRSIVETADKGLLAVGIIQYSTFRCSIVILKTDSLGNEQWRKFYNHQYWSLTGTGIYKSDSGYIVTGLDDNYPLGTNEDKVHPYMMEIDTAGNGLWKWFYTANNKTAVTYTGIRTDDNGYILSGYKIVGQQSGGGDRKTIPYVMKLDSGKSIVWQTSIGEFSGGDPTWEFINKTIIDKEGNLIVTGTTQFHNVEVGSFYNYGLLAKLSGNGDSLWARPYNISRDTLIWQSNWNEFNGIVANADGGYTMVGEARDNFQGGAGQQLWLVRVDSNGCVQENYCSGSKPVGIEEVRLPPIEAKVYPNPAKDKLYVEYIIPNGKTEGLIEMYDVHGRAVKTINLHNSLGREEINISDWQNGIYHYKVICVNCNTQSGKVVIIK